MGTKVHYPAETKWKAVEMKMEGYSRREIMETLGIKNITQLKTWMRWYRNGETHRFNQPVGKQYSYGKGPSDLSEIEKKDIEIRQLRAKVAVLEKYVEVSRRWGLK
jgi:transposase